MPVYYNSPKRKSNGFSIDDLIRNESRTKPSTVLAPPIGWFPSTSNLYQLQRESMLQFFRQTNQYHSMIILFLNKI